MAPARRTDFIAASAESNMDNLFIQTVLDSLDCWTKIGIVGKQKGDVVRAVNGPGKKVCHNSCINALFDCLDNRAARRPFSRHTGTPSPNQALTRALPGTLAAHVTRATFFLSRVRASSLARPLGQGLGKHGVSSAARVRFGDLWLGLGPRLTKRAKGAIDNSAQPWLTFDQLINTAFVFNRRHADSSSFRLVPSSGGASAICCNAL